MRHCFRQLILAAFVFCLFSPMLPAAHAAEAESGTVLSYLIELYRRQNKPCGDRTMPQPPLLTYSTPLRDAARELAMGGGRDLHAILAAQGLKASRFHSFTTGEVKAEDAMARLKADHCLALLEPYTHIGAARENERWWVIMAVLEPLASQKPSGEGSNATAPAAPGETSGYPGPGAAAGPATTAPVPTPNLGAAKPRATAQAPDAKAIAARINAIRGNGVSCGGKHKPPVPALAASASLGNAAQKHAQDMADKGYFGTTSPSGVSLESRVHGENYAWALVTELISKGPPPASAVVDLWLSTPSQCEQIMDAAFTDMGVGVSGEYWTLILGKPAVGVASPEP